MIKTFLTSAAALTLATSAQADLLITEVVDGTLPGGQPKWVELTNTGASSVDLSLYSFGNFNNGGTTLGGGASTALVGTLGAGSSYVIGYMADPGGPGLSEFFLAYGLEVDFYMGGGYVNGDDVLTLFLGVGTGDGTDATTIDVYGVLGVDGSGMTWETTDSYAYRCGNTANGGVFDESDWTIAGANALEGTCGGDDVCELANLLAETTPWVHAGCGNVSGAEYCAEAVYNCPCFVTSAVGEGCPNSTGIGGTILGAGTPSVGSSSFSLTAAQMPDTVGLFVQGVNTAGGADGNAVGEGRLCLGPQKRYQPQSIAGGTVTRSNFQNFATAGSAMNYQFWYRDPANNCAGSGFNFTPAWAVTWTP